MNNKVLEEVLEEGKEVLSILYEGDSPGSSGWIGIYEFQNIYYVITDFEENYGPFESFEKALEFEILEDMSVSFELKSETLSAKELKNINAIIQIKSK